MTIYSKNKNLGLLKSINQNTKDTLEMQLVMN